MAGVLRSSDLAVALRKTEQIVWRVAVCGCLEILPSIVCCDDHVGTLAVHQYKVAVDTIFDISNCIVFSMPPAAVSGAANSLNSFVRLVVRGAFRDALNL